MSPKRKRSSTVNFAELEFKARLVGLNHRQDFFHLFVYYFREEFSALGLSAGLTSVTVTAVELLREVSENKTATDFADFEIVDYLKVIHSLRPGMDEVVRRQSYPGLVEQYFKVFDMGP